MKQVRLPVILLAVFMLSIFPTSTILAAPGTSVLGTGTIQSIDFETDSAGVTTVLVTMLDDGGLAQVVRVSLADAYDLGLLTDGVAPADPVTLTDPVLGDVTGTVSGFEFVTDPVTGETTVTVSVDDGLGTITPVTVDLQTAYDLGLVNSDPAKIDTPIVIDPATIIDSTTYTKIVTLLGKFFGSSLGISYDQYAAYVEAGMGYGVIAQASWMAINLGGDAALLDQIIAAKTSGDFSTLTLPDGSTVKNWGQLRKAAITSASQNLGSIVSGKAEPPDTAVTTSGQGSGNVNSNGNTATGNGNNGNNSNTDNNGNNGNAGNNGNNGNSDNSNSNKDKDKTNNGKGNK